MSNCSYLGDGVYAVSDETGGIELRANNHLVPSDTIYLEPKVLKNLGSLAKVPNLNQLTTSNIEKSGWFESNILLADPDTLTLGVLKPKTEALHESILKWLYASNIEVLATRKLTFTKNDVRALYWTHIGKDFYTRNEEYMLSGESIVMVLTGVGVISRWRALMEEIRLVYGPIVKPHTIVHGSENREASFHELLYFFGDYSWDS